MNIFKSLKNRIEAKINAAYEPNVEYVFEHSLSENTKSALVEISEHLISQLDLDATVLEKVVFYYEENETRYINGEYVEADGIYEECTRTAKINCADMQAFNVIWVIAHELYHAKQFAQTWGFGGNFDETEAEDYAMRQTDRLMQDYWERLSDDFPSNF